MTPGMPVRREFEYRRHGTLTLMGALDVRLGKVFGLAAALYEYMIWRNQNSRPFHWSYRPKSWAASHSATQGGSN